MSAMIGTTRTASASCGPVQPRRRPSAVADGSEPAGFAQFIDVVHAESAKVAPTHKRKNTLDRFFIMTSQSFLASGTPSGAHSGARCPSVGVGEDPAFLASPLCCVSAIGHSVRGGVTALSSTDGIPTASKFSSPMHKRAGLFSGCCIAKAGSRPAVVEIDLGRHSVNRPVEWARPILRWTPFS